MAVLKSSFLDGITIKKSCTFQVLECANKTDESLPGDILNPVSVADMPEDVRDESKGNNESLPIFPLFVFPGDKRHHRFEARGTVYISRDHATEAMNGFASDLD